MTPARFSPSQAKILDETKYLYVRSGGEHRFIAVWVVVVEGRVCIRSWNDKPTGWFRAFQKERTGAIKVGEREVPVRALLVRGSRLNDAVDRAYAKKYTSRANAKYTQGFRTARRKATTTELVPA